MVPNNLGENKVNNWYDKMKKDEYDCFKIRILILYLLDKRIVCYLNEFNV